MRFVTLCLVLILISPLQADYDAGLAAYQRGDFETAYSQWLAVAESPPESVPPALMAETCYALGMLFWVGQGVIQDSAASAQWLLRAAELGHPGAQTKLGYLYGSGQGVQQSDFAALKWTQMAANQGDVDAQYNLGVFYRDGHGGVEQNSELALKWFREAASNGDQISVDVLANYEKYGWPRTNSVTSSVTGNVTGSEPSKVTAESDDPVKVDELDSLESSMDAVSQAEGLVEVPAGPETTSIDAQSGHTGDNGVDEDSQPVVSETIKDELWISQQNPQHFTIQVIALLSPVNLHQFADQNSDSGPFAIYQQRWKGKPLFVMLQGDYADLEQARAAAAGFPLGLQKREELWIRKFVMVQVLLQRE